VIEYGEYEGDSKSNKKYSGHYENHKGNVYDVFHETSESKAEVGKHGTILLWLAGTD
jgi:hypothetical protein